MKPKTFKKPNKNKKIFLSRQSSATISIGKIKKNMDTFILTYGQFSLIDALITILDQTGKADVIISTWTAAHAHLDKEKELMENDKIKSLKMIVDRSFKTRQPQYSEHMIELFGVGSIREINTHSKFLVIKNKKWNIVVRTSMNLNNNPRLENIEISENKEFVKFFVKIADDIFDELKPGERLIKPPELKSLDNFPLFNIVKSDQVDTNNLKEVKYSHVITNKKTIEQKDTTKNN